MLILVGDSVIFFKNKSVEQESVDFGLFLLFVSQDAGRAVDLLILDLGRPKIRCYRILSVPIEATATQVAGTW